MGVMRDMILRIIRGKNTFRMMIIVLVISIVLSMTSSVHAATISGTVYDLSLEPIDALIEIDTVPKQFFVALGGDYLFNMNPGHYTLRANTTEGTAIEMIEIVEDGNYTIDMIIGLDIEEPPEFIDEPYINDITTGLNGTENNNKNAYLWITPSVIGIAIIVLLAIAIVFLFISKDNNAKAGNADTAKESAKVADDAYKISGIPDIELRTIALIREHSRITQKELRKMLPYSEAKISLIVAQLESEGKVKKIKKGRGNILVYVKD